MFFYIIKDMLKDCILFIKTIIIDFFISSFVIPSGFVYASEKNWPAVISTLLVLNTFIFPIAILLIIAATQCAELVYICVFILITNAFSGIYEWYKYKKIKIIGEEKTENICKGDHSVYGNLNGALSTIDYMTTDEAKIVR